MFGARFKFALLAGLAAAGGCRKPCPPITLETAGVEPIVRYNKLATVLAETVSGRGGRIDVDVLRRNVAALDAQVRTLAVTGPTATPKQFPTREHVLAYWYNARAAWSLKLLLACDCPSEVRRQEFEDRQFPLDGRVMTLRQLDAILAGENDFRVAVASPGITTHHASLPRKPFAPEGLRQQIAKRFAAFLDDETRFVIDVRKRRIVVPPVLWQFRDRLLAAHRQRYGVESATLTTTLLAYVTGSPHRRLQDAIGYRTIQATDGKRPTCLEGR